MDIISGFLKKYKRIIKDDTDLKNAILSSIKETCGLSVESEGLRVKENSINITCPQIFKNDIFLKKDILLENINEKTGLKFKYIKF